MAAKTNAKVQAAVEREEKLLGDTGRVLLRPSGTEPLVRVMAEAETQQQADEVCDRLAKVVADELTLVRARKEICPMFGHNSKVDLELNREVEKLIKTGGKEKIMPIVQAGEPVLRRADHRLRRPVEPQNA